MPITVWGQTFDGFDSAVDHVMSKGGYSNDTAKKIVGKAQSEQEAHSGEHTDIYNKIKDQPGVDDPWAVANYIVHKNNLEAVGHVSDLRHDFLPNYVKESIRVAEEILRKSSNTRKQESITMPYTKGCLVKLASMPRTEALQEAMKVLDEIKADKLVRYTVGLALRMTDDSEKKMALEEAETHMTETEDETEAETEDETETEGSKKKTKMSESNAPTGTSTQSTSSTDTAAGVSDRLSGHDVRNRKSEPGNHAGQGRVTETTFDFNGAIVRHMASGKKHEEAMREAMREKAEWNEKRLQETIKDINYLYDNVIPGFKQSITSLQSQLKEVKENNRASPGTLTFDKSNSPLGLMSAPTRTQETTGNRNVDIDSMRKEIAEFDTMLDATS